MFGLVDSPFELVLWIPYVNVIRTKCMFILPATENDKHLKRIEGATISSTSGIMAEVEEDLTWVEMRFGEIMIFTQNLMHGNVLNQETTTRWSSNCRFKSLLSPYSDKKLGEFLSQYPYEQPLDLGCIINCQILEATDGKAWISRLHIIPASWFARVPQHIQNLTIREYAERNQLAYLLSGVEYCMENSYLMLNEIAAELESIEGIILTACLCCQTIKPVVPNFSNVLLILALFYMQLWKVLTYLMRQIWVGGRIFF